MDARHEPKPDRFGNPEHREILLRARRKTYFQNEHIIFIYEHIMYINEHIMSINEDIMFIY